MELRLDTEDSRARVETRTLCEGIRHPRVFQLCFKQIPVPRGRVAHPPPPLMSVACYPNIRLSAPEL
jgi:hypothetical protein